MSKKVMMFVALLAVLSIMLVACGDGTQKETSKEPVSTGAENVKDTLVVATNAGPADLDPHGTNDQNSNDVRFQIYEALVGVDVDGSIVPRLATEWEWVDDTTIKFTLRDGVKFQDGSLLTADDVLFSLKRASEGDFTASWLTDVLMDKMEALDEKTIQLKLNVPVGALLSRLSNVMIVSKAAWESKTESEMLKNPMGTGPYKLVEWFQGDRLEFVAHEDYWGEPVAFPKLVMRIIPESSARALEIEAGTVDVSLVVQAADIGTLERDENISIVTNPSYMITYLGFDCSKAPYDNVKVRQALSYSIDKGAIAENVYSGLGSPALHGRLSEVYWGYNKDVASYEYNPEKAKELLAEAGYPDGFDMTLALSEAEQDQIDMSEIIKNQLAQVGVNVKLEIMENATFLDMIVNGPFDAFLLNSVGNSADPGEALKSFLEDRPTWSNTTRYYNTYLTDLIKNGQQTIDEDDKLDIFKEAQEIIAEECPWVFLIHNTTTFAVRENIVGMKAYPYRVHMFKEAKLK